MHGLYNKITQDSKSPYDGYRKDKNGNYIRVDSRGGDKIDYLYDEEGNIIASTPVSFTEIEVGPYRRTYGQGTKYVSPALYDPSFDIFAWWASGEVLGIGKGVTFLQEVFIKATGGLKQWVRFGRSFSKSGGFETKGIRWGAGGKYYEKIGNQKLRELNKSLRKKKLPVNNWRVKDHGHFHLWKK